jgi:thiosulfate dehydrogenase (quinone) large subunit
VERDPRRLADDKAAVVGALIIRLAVGILWIENLSWMVPPRFGADDGSGLYHFTGLAIEYPVLPVYSSFVESVVLPHFALFAWGVYFLEVSLGVFLLLGLATRFWALIGILQTVAIFLSVSAAPWEWKWSYYLMALAHLAVLAQASGRILGVDALMRRRVRGSSLPSRLYRLAS